jgi:zeaxanthin glucosyltransferase
MSHLGVICIPGAGHLYPAVALGRALRLRGHDVTLFSVWPGAQASVRGQGLRFGLLASRKDYAEQGAAHFQPAKLSTASVLRLASESVLRGSCDAIKSAQVDALVVDQADFASGSVAELLGIPFVNVSFFPPIYLNDLMPPSYFGWSDRRGTLARLRNRVGNAYVARRVFGGALKNVNQFRRQHRLTEFKDVNQVFSNRAIISQLPEALEFSRRREPDRIYYTGPFTDELARRSVPFPWDRLEGKRLVYASMGTFRNALHRPFAKIARACADLDVQLVISLGGQLPGAPIVVPYAPQLDLLNRASIAITHGGLNTVLESLARGVPLIAIPVADDQPGVAARVRHAGAGRVLSLRMLSANHLRSVIHDVLESPKYRSAAWRLQAEIRNSGGTGRAAELIETTLGLVPTAPARPDCQSHCSSIHSL